MKNILILMDFEGAAEGGISGCRAAVGRGVE